MWIRCKLWSVLYSIGYTTQGYVLARFTVAGLHNNKHVNIKLICYDRLPISLLL